MIPNTDMTNSSCILRGMQYTYYIERKYKKQVNDHMCRFNCFWGGGEKFLAADPGNFADIDGSFF